MIIADVESKYYMSLTITLETFPFCGLIFNGKSSFLKAEKVFAFSYIVLSFSCCLTVEVCGRIDSQNQGFEFLTLNSVAFKKQC